MADDAYGGLLGAVPYAYRRADSRLFRSYVVVGGLLAAFVALLFLNGIVTLVAATVGATGGSLTIVRAFFVVVMLATVAPILAPILLVARRIRREANCPASQQRLWGVAGYAYLFSLYVGLVVSAPADTEPPATGALAPVIEALNAAPDAWGYAPPVAVALAMVALARVVR